MRRLTLFALTIVILMASACSSAPAKSAQAPGDYPAGFTRVAEPDKQQASGSKISKGDLVGGTWRSTTKCPGIMNFPADITFSSDDKARSDEWPFAMTFAILSDGRLELTLAGASQIRYVPVKQSDGLINLVYNYMDSRFDKDANLIQKPASTSCAYRKS